MADDRVTRGKALFQALGASGYNFPLHALWRLDALVAGEEVVYAEGLADGPNGSHVSGSAVVITNSRVIRCDFQDTNGVDVPDRGASTVHCGCWARRALSHVELDTEPAGDNLDLAWSKDWGAEWPRGVRVTLAYGSTDRQVSLPLDPSRADSCARFGAAIPDLLADFGR